MSQIRAEKSGSVTAKDIGDKHECNINGMDVTYNGTIIVVDYKNKKLKYFSPDNTVLSVLSLPARPTALTVVNATTAVAPAANNKLYIIRISDQSVLSLKGKMQLQYYILAITNYKGYLVATCMTDPRCVKMIVSQGNELWSVSRDELGRDLFSWPCGIVTTTFNTAVVVVSSFGNDTLTLLEATNGKLIRTIDLEGKMPSGITLDNNGNAYNCHWQTDEIFVWSNEFNENRILLSKDQLEKSPRFIVYCGMNNCLYVAYDDNNKIDCFQLL